MSQSPDNRMIRVRSAAQDATDFQMTDEQVRRFIELRDDGANRDRIVAELGVDEEVAHELIRADESYATAHRIATGELRMYPPPEPGTEVIDARVGSDWVPIAVIVLVLVGIIIWTLVR